MDVTNRVGECEVDRVTQEGDKCLLLIKVIKFWVP
jgi:flavin reductase (DIM6/NTAB) family NADH-FMN oxidoreductase RutF